MTVSTIFAANNWSDFGEQINQSATLISSVSAASNNVNATSIIANTVYVTDLAKYGSSLTFGTLVSNTYARIAIANASHWMSNNYVYRSGIFANTGYVAANTYVQGIFLTLSGGGTVTNTTIFAAGTVANAHLLTANNIKLAPSGQRAAIQPTRTWNFERGVMPGGNFTFTRSTVGARRAANGTIEYVAANLPRFDYDPISLQCMGVLLEANSVNMVPYSSRFDQWTDGAAMGTPTSNVAVSPTGANTADLLIVTTASAIHYQRKNMTKVAANVSYAMSVYLKQANSTTTPYAYPTMYDGSSGEIGMRVDLRDGSTDQLIQSGGFSRRSYSVTDEGDGWYRARVSGISTTTTAISPTIHIGDDSQGSFTATYVGNTVYNQILSWGGQVEPNKLYSTSHIDTTASFVHREADVLYLGPVNQFVNFYQGTLYAKWSSYVPNDLVEEQKIVSIEKDASNYMTMYRTSTTNFMRFRFKVAGDDKMIADTGTDTALSDTTHHSALIWNSNTGYGVSDQSVTGLDSIISTPTTSDKIRFGDWAGAQPLNGHLKEVKIFGAPLSNTNIKAMS